jgi:hypothetical protein
MEGIDMEPFALWGENPHSKPEAFAAITDIKDYIAINVPRNMLRPAASKFCDVRHADPKARFDEIHLQLFAKMVYDTINLPEDLAPGDLFPYVECWLQWIPHASLEHKAVAYIIHAVSRHKDVKFGNALNNMLAQNSVVHNASIARKSNSRKVDPLAGLKYYQKWSQVAGVEMYVRTVADRYSGTQRFTSKMDKILNPKCPLSAKENAANPRYVFTIDRALELIPDTVDPKFRDRAAYTGDATSNEPVTTLQFPSSEHVIRLTPSQIHPKVLCGKYLPDHQSWMTAQSAIPAKKLDDGYDANCETEYDIRTPADIERARLEGMADRSAFQTLEYQAKARYAQNCGPVEHVPDLFEQKYREHQDWAVHAMQTQCLDPDACISEVVSKMLRWRTTSKCKTVHHDIKDPTLSVFANRCLVLLEGYEQYYLISTAHRMLYLIQHARYDAFRRDFGLHLNCFQAGDGATSKSFLFLLMEKLSIDGTTEVLTYQTGKSDAVDGNRNDVVTVCHEAPPGMFRTAKNPNADSSQEAMFKEKLTSQRVTCKTWCQDEGTGKRSSRITKSECVGVWMGATNDAKGDVEEALQTRFFWGNFEQQQRRGRDIDDCMNGERMFSTEDKAHRKVLFEEGKEEQYRVMLVEKAIWTKVIKDVDATASNILVPRFKAKMSKNSIIRPGPRDWERVKLFARNQAIVTAIESVCNIPGGKHYGQPFSEVMIPDLEPFLRVTEEMILFTLSLFADQFRSPVEHKILNTIWTMEKSTPTFGNPANSEEASFDYVKLPKLRQLSRKINSRIPLEQGRTSTNNIEDFLLKMTKHSFKSKKFVQSAVPPGSQPSNNKLSVIDPKKSKPRKYDSCVINNDGVFIHVAHLVAHSSSGTDSVFESIAQETHKYSTEKRIITACPLSAKWFHVFKVIERKPGGRKLEYKNVLANSVASRFITGTKENATATRTKDGYKIECDIDQHVADKWSKKIGKPCLTPMEMVQRHVEADPHPRIRYPVDLVGDTIVESEDETEDEEDDDEEETVGNKRNRAEDEYSTNKKNKIQ